MRKNMKKIIFIVLSIFLGFSVMAENTADPYAILDVLQKQYSYDDQDYSATVTLIVEKPNQPAEQLQFKLFQRAAKKQFTMIQLLPETDKGAGYLQDGDNLWYYDPIGRKFNHTSLKQNIGNSDAKAGDVVKEYSFRDDYEATSIESGKLGAFDVWIISLKAISSRPAYAKEVYYIRKDITLLLKEENYSANDKLMRTILYPKYTRVLDRYLPIQIIMRDEVNKGEQTQQILSEISTSAIPNKVFTKAYLEGLN